MLQAYWLPGFNFNVKEWFEGDRYETLAISRTLEAARAAFAAAVAEKPDGRFMIHFPAFYTDHVDRRLAACACGGLSPPTIGLASVD